MWVTTKVTELHPPAPMIYTTRFGRESDARAVTFLVSSRHLILASLGFKAMMTGKWLEATAKDNLF